MQLLWLEKRGWDEVMSPKFQEIWQSWEDKLPHMNFLKIPRWNNFNPNASFLELHGFADASKRAYGCCLYLKAVHNEQALVTLILSKSKVASL